MTKKKEKEVPECPSAQVPGEVPECPSTEVAREVPGCQSAQVPGEVPECPSAQVPVEEKPEVAEAGDSAEAADGKTTTPPDGHPSGAGEGQDAIKPPRAVGTPPGQGTAEVPECPSTEVPGSDKNIVVDLVESLVERAREVFGMHTADEIYFTSDGQAFTEEQHARAHAGWLKDETVVTVKRTEV